MGVGVGTRQGRKGAATRLHTGYRAGGGKPGTFAIEGQTQRDLNSLQRICTSFQIFSISMQ